MEATKKLPYIDNLRLFVIMLVVVMHLSLTYGGTGGWYYTESRLLSGGEATFFSFFQAFMQAFMMGLLFLISGYWAPGAYDTQGFGRFLKDSAVRLGLPVLLYMLVIGPFTEYMPGSHRPEQGFISFWAENITSLRVLSGTGPLWFALALLLLTVIYALIRRISGKARSSAKKPLNAAALVMLVPAIALLTFFARISFPINAAAGIPLGHATQYIVLFVAGIFAYRYNIFSRLNRSHIGLLYTAPLWGFGVWVALMMACQAFWSGDYSLFSGGLTCPSALYAFWESFTAAAMCVSLLALFKHWFNHQGRLTQKLSASAFAVYVFHAPVIVAITLLFRPVDWAPFLKFIVMTAVCLPVCLAISYVLTRIPLLNKIL